MDYKDLNIGEGSPLTAADLAKMRAKMARRVNQQLRRLEKSKSIVSGKAYKAGAYDEATEYLRGQGKRRFSESPNYYKTKDSETGETAYNVYKLKTEILELDRLINMKSFTITGNREIEKNRIDTFVNEHGVSEAVAADDAFYDYLNSASYDYILKSQLSSETLVNIYDEYRDVNKSSEDIQSAIDKAVRDHKEAMKNTDKPQSMSVSDLVKSLNSTLKTNVKVSDVLPAGGAKIEGSST